jgi:hypothetical protein
MKYYCKKCGSSFEPGSNYKWVNLSWDAPNEEWECPICVGSNCIIQIPKYETPEQYKERTGEEYPDDRMVWQFLKPTKKWIGVPYNMAKENLINISISGFYGDIIIADPFITIPDTWKINKKRK